MPKRSSKPPTDLNRLATSIVARATADESPSTRERQPEPEKNAAAVALGRLGGRKGGKARAEALSDEKRSEIARKAANARWKNRP